jgi:Fe-S cluster assembly iron-binding protein IscA
MEGITERAGAKLTAMLEQANGPRHMSLRFLGGGEQGAELKFDQEHEHDRAFTYAGRTVLLVDPLVMAKSSGWKLDYQDGRFCYVSSREGRIATERPVAVLR